MSFLAIILAITSFRNSSVDTFSLLEEKCHLSLDLSQTQKICSDNICIIYRMQIVLRFWLSELAFVEYKKELWFLCSQFRIAIKKRI